MLIPEPSSGTLLTSDNCRIHYEHYQTGRKQALVIAHGFYNSAHSELINVLGKALCGDYDVVILDFRGHGKSEGLFYWTAKEQIDLETVLKFAHKHYSKVGVIGFSLGAAISLNTAAKTELIDSLIAVSAPTEFEKIEFALWDLDFENDIVYNFAGQGMKGKGVRPGHLWKKKDKPIELVDKIRIPVFYIHGDKDWVIRHWHSQELFDKTLSFKRLKIIKNGPHAEYLIREKFKDETIGLMKEWFKETLP